MSAFVVASGYVIAASDSQSAFAAMCPGLACFAFFALLFLWIFLLKRAGAKRRAARDERVINAQVEAMRRFKDEQ